MPPLGFPSSLPRSVTVLFAVSLLASVASHAALIDKADNTTALDTGSSWLGGVAPGPADIARWSASVTSAGTVNLGSNAAWLGITVTNPGGGVTIGAGNTLTLGHAGIDLSTATQNLTISSGLALSAGHQAWNVTAGRTLTLGTGAFTRPAGATLNIQGAGTVAASMSGLANDATGILGAWATIGTGADTRYATLSAGNLAAFTGTAVAQFTTVPSGSGGAAINYDIAAISSSIGSGRSANTIRYTGAAGTVGGNAGYTLNGLMNVGSGALTIGGISLNIGSQNELVINAVTHDIILTTSKITGTNKSLTVRSSSGTKVSSNAVNSYTGNTAITAGTFALGAAGTVAGSPVIRVYNGATFDVSAKDAAGLTLGATQTLINNGTVTGNLVVNGTAGGSGVISGTLAGTGSINPGNSPGILAAAAINSPDLDFNFEFTAAGSPDYGNAAASRNDVLRLTAATPFASALGAGNAVNIYLNVTALSNGDTFRGGFFTDTAGDFTGSIFAATFACYLADAGGAVTYNGVSYSLYTGLPVTVSTLAALAAFAGGDINGQVAQFTFGSAIPEPSAVAALAGAFALTLAALRRRSRRHA